MIPFKFCDIQILYCFLTLKVDLAHKRGNGSGAKRKGKAVRNHAKYLQELRKYPKCSEAYCAICDLDFKHGSYESNSSR